MGRVCTGSDRTRPAEPLVAICQVLDSSGRSPKVISAGQSLEPGIHFALVLALVAAPCTAAIGSLSRQCLKVSCAAAAEAVGQQLD